MFLPVSSRPPAAATSALPPVFSARRLLLAAILVALPPLAILLLLPPLPQPAAYHGFADNRAWLQLPHAADVLTNRPFLLVGLWGLRTVLRRPELPLRAIWFTFSASVTLVAFGSAWYHLAPTDASLVWDRLPIAAAFMSLFAAVVGESASARLGQWALAPLLLAGLGSVLWWRHAGDLRPYFALQALALLGIPVLLLSFHRPGQGRGWLGAGLVGYGLAFAAEKFDGAVYAATRGWCSGHSLKHGLAALACAAVVTMLAFRRRPATPTSAANA